MALRLTTEEFVKRSKLCHGDKYDYTKTDLSCKDDKDRVVITCPIHGDFLQNIHYHTRGHGCPQCGKNTVSSKLQSSQEYFIQQVIEKYGDKYDLSKVDYKGNKVKVCIGCRKHGDFYITPNNLLRGHGCAACYGNKKHTVDSFVDIATKVHDGKYDYSKVEYINDMTKVCIICPKHGEFWQRPQDHLNMQQGCPSCGMTLSHSENAISKYISSLLGQENVIKHERTLLDGKEIDIFVPSMSLGIEYNGLRWHTEWFSGKDKDYHLNKTIGCLKKGVKLIQIFEDEYVNHKEIVLSKIRHLLKVDNNLPRIMGRKCFVREISSLEAEGFLNMNHIQGFVASSVYLGAFHNDNLVGVMTFKKENEDNWELTRFASDIHYISQGISGKMFKHFIRTYNPTSIKSFADRRWTVDDTDNMYVKLGFQLDSILKPDYKYFNSSVDKFKRFHKFGFRKQILAKKYGLSMDMTESEMVKELGYDRIWDCGLFKFVWKR